jgi:hypothetical protein
VFSSGVASDASNKPSEKKHAVSKSILFQKKRLCLNLSIADIEQQQQHQHQQKHEQEEELKEQDEEDEHQHSDSEFGVQHDDDSNLLFGSLDDGPHVATDAADPAL